VYAEVELEPILRTLWQDIRFARECLARRRIYRDTVLTLALASAQNTAIFSSSIPCSYAACG